MDYERLSCPDAEQIGNYLGFSRFKWLGGPVRKRSCPNCKPENHDGFEVVTSELCEKYYWRCPACTHGDECAEFMEGRFSRELAAPGHGLLQRFIDLREFAARCGISLSTARRWVSSGKLTAAQGVACKTYKVLIDTDKCPLLKADQQAVRSRRGCAAA